MKSEKFYETDEDNNVTVLYNQAKGTNSSNKYKKGKYLNRRERRIREQELLRANKNK